jgi:murein DD-endopeptidase MepM/ murein hydrolase activator NlpD
LRLPSRFVERVGRAVTLGLVLAVLLWSRSPARPRDAASAPPRDAAVAQWRDAGANPPRDAHADLWRDARAPSGDPSTALAAATGPFPDPAPFPPVVKHIILPGETLSGIAEFYDTDIASIVYANNLFSRDLLSVGAQLKVPTTPGLLHTVVAGDTPSALAAHYGIEQADILSVNVLDPSGALRPGDEIVLPGAKPPVTMVTVASRGAGDRPPAPAGGSGGGSGILYIWPAEGFITSGYGPRSGRMHEGIDLAASMGAPVVAARGGVVVRAGWRDGYGYAVEIGHGGGISTLYAHLSEILAGVGRNVAQGELVARVGSTGRSTGPHLHFEIRTPGGKVDPLAYLP